VKEHKRKPGEFQVKRKERQNHQARYNAIRDACALAKATGRAEVVVSGRKFYLSGEERPYDVTFYAFLRMLGYGLVAAEVCTKDHGYQEILFPNLGQQHWSPTTVTHRFAAVIVAIVDVETGKVLYGNLPTHEVG
jgi:hypothetical protein